MPQVIEYPTPLKPYRFHGVHLEWRRNDKNARATCPFCAREEKFAVDIERGVWRCLICTTGSDKGGGNIYTFMRLVWQQSLALAQDYRDLKDRRLNPETLKRWGVCRSFLNNDWIIPGFNVSCKLTQLYRYCPDPKTGKRRLLATPEIQHGLFGLNLWEDTKESVYITEGPWDAMAWWEALKEYKQEENGKGLIPTASEPSSLLGVANVVAAPGCSVFQDGWLPLFEGKKVAVMYDNDHPRIHPVTKQLIPPAGHEGMKRAVVKLITSESPPEEVLYLSWAQGKDHNAELPSGHDLRDHLTKDSPLTAEKVAALYEMLSTVPPTWIGKDFNTKKGHVGELELIKCDTWNEMIKAWTGALKWTDGLDIGLSCMLACVASTKAIGDQLWLKVIGPAACGKSTLCEALSTNRKYVVAKSAIRGFHSGFRSDAAGEEDNSLIAQITGKTFITKDGDTLLQSPNLNQILSEARDLYDSISRTHYRNQMSKNYEGVRMTWILCGTGSLSEIDSSELGERFLTVVLMDHIDDDLEDEILERKALQADQCLAFQADGKIDTHHDATLLKAMQLTGGYVTYLRQNARDLLSQVQLPNDSKRRCIRLAKLVAYLRARPSRKQEEVAEREFATRLVSQCIRLAKCLAVVLNHHFVDAEIMRRVTKVMMDTARGRTLELAKRLYESGTKGLEVSSLAHETNQPEESERKYLRFMRKIGIVELFKPKPKRQGVHPRSRFRLTEKFYNIYREAINAEG